MFEDYYKKKTGQVLKVFYEGFSTNEEMYQQLKLGAIKPDLIVPSDYMIQRMANENRLENSTTIQLLAYGEVLSNR